MSESRNPSQSSSLKEEDLIYSLKNTWYEEETPGRLREFRDNKADLDEPMSIYRLKGQLG